MKRQVLQTRRPAGLDCATLTPCSFGVKWDPLPLTPSHCTYRGPEHLHDADLNRDLRRTLLEGQEQRLLQQREVGAERARGQQVSQLTSLGPAESHGRLRA